MEQFKTEFPQSHILVSHESVLKKAAKTLRAINHPLRRKILALLLDKGKTTVTEVYVALRLEQSLASQHLAILRKAGLVKIEKDGKFVNYSLDETRITRVVELACDLQSD